VPSNDFYPVVTADGTEHPVDTVIFATGFCRRTRTFQTADFLLHGAG
jgi:hypothetical protein